MAAIFSAVPTESDSVQDAVFRLSPPGVGVGRERRKNKVKEKHRVGKKRKIEEGRERESVAAAPTQPSQLELNSGSGLDQALLDVPAFKKEEEEEEEEKRGRKKRKKRERERQRGSGGCCCRIPAPHTCTMGLTRAKIPVGHSLYQCRGPHKVGQAGQTAQPHLSSAHLCGLHSVEGLWAPRLCNNPLSGHVLGPSQFDSNQVSKGSSLRVCAFPSNINGQFNTSDYSIPCGWKFLLVLSVVHLDISLHGSVLEFHPWRWELSSAIEERGRLRKDAIAWKKQKSREAEGEKAHDSLVKADFKRKEYSIPGQLVGFDSRGRMRGLGCSITKTGLKMSAPARSKVENLIKERDSLVQEIFDIKKSLAKMEAWMEMQQHAQSTQNLSLPTIAKSA